MSSTLHSQFSPNLVHPMPTMETLSLMLSAIFPSFGADWPALPEIVVQSPGFMQLAEGHFHGHTHPHGLRVAIGHLAVDPVSAFHFYYGHDHGGVNRGIKVVPGKSKYFAFFIRQ